MKSKIKLSFIVLIIHLSFVVNAQKVNVSTFAVFKTEKQALLHWIIDSGATCNGVSIFHSIDNTDFTEIGHIAGVCGSINASKAYNYTDEAPNIYGANYYKLRFGTIQFSDVQQIDFNYIDSKTVVIKPNPTSDILNIEFSNEKNELYSLKIIDSKGNAVYQNNYVTTSQFSVNIAHLVLGNYVLILDDNKGKIFSKQLIVSK